MRHFDYFHVSVCASRGKNDDGKQLNQKQQQQKKAQNEMAHTHTHWRTSISRLTHTQHTHMQQVSGLESAHVCRTGSAACARRKLLYATHNVIDAA